MSLCFLLTAGLGTRLRPFTDIRPKPCLPFLNLPLMNYSFYLARQAGFDHFLLNLHHLPNQVKKQGEHLASYAQSLDFSNEVDQILGSGGALFKARSLLSKNDDFLVANGDEVLIPEDTKVLGRLMSKRRQDHSLACLLTCDHPELLKSFNAVWVNDKQEVVGFGKTPPSAGCRPVHYTGYKAFSRDVFKYVPEGESNIFYEVLTKAIAQGERVTHLHLGPVPWFETGNLDAFISASRQVAANHPEYLKEIHHFFQRNIGIHRNDKDGLLVLANTDLEFMQKLIWDGIVVLGSGVKNIPPSPLRNLIVERDFFFTPESPTEQSLLLNPHQS